MRNHFHRSLDLPVRVKVFVVHKAVQSLSAVLSLDLSEASFNRVEFWRITNVLDLHDVKLLVALDDFFRFVDTELIHEDGKASVFVYLPQLIQVLDELCGSNRLVVYVVPFDTTIS